MRLKPKDITTNLLVEESGSEVLDVLVEQHGASDDLAERGKGLVDRLDEADGVVALQLDERQDRRLAARLLYWWRDLHLDQVHALKYNSSTC